MLMIDEELKQAVRYEIGDLMVDSVVAFLKFDFTVFKNADIYKNINLYSFYQIQHYYFFSGVQDLKHCWFFEVLNSVLMSNHNVYTNEYLIFLNELEQEFQQQLKKSDFVLEISLFVDRSNVEK